MRIDGMDASTFSTVEYKKPDVTPKDTQVKQKDKPELTEVKSLSQLSDFDRKELPISEKVVIDAIDRVNRAISGANRRFEFSIHEKTKEIMIKVVDSDTNQVVREIPPEKILDMVANMM
ncbi:MAG: hypothetical protein A2Y21_08210 [Clostridiales bacterium GWC2_40_7]|nr:MAG: hypothetical protein A2Y21_08210 [Clostridiales bacterium GWC2_40_7]